MRPDFQDELEIQATDEVKIMENEVLTITYEGKEEKTIEELIPNGKNFCFVRAEIENRLRELSYVVKGPVTIKLFKLAGDTESMYIYKNTLRYVVSMAVRNVLPDVSVKFSNDISRSIYVRASEPSKFKINTLLIAEIEKEIQRLIDADLPIKKRLITKKEAIAQYKAVNMEDKLDILAYRSEQMVHQYVCGDYFDYMYGYMMPSTGYIHTFKILPKMPGFLVQFPRAEFKGQIPPFTRETVFERTLEASRKWSALVGLSTIADVNDTVRNLGSTDFIMMSEAHHSNQLAELGLQIVNSPSEIKLICIAGPSSSGKTTFANRLRLELLSLGINPIRLSVDDYYLPKVDMIKEPDGSVDLESIKAFDVQLFNQDMLKLIEGEKVTIPAYDFKTGSRHPGRTLQLAEGQPIIVEGIHALNEQLTNLIPKHEKFKIFIAPQAQINVDDHTPISLTDLRLLRRIVRDAKFRHSSAEETLDMWPSVRKGEFTWIYSTQESADYVFNSLLPYELCVMREHAMPLLSQVKKTSKHYVTCRRLINFLKYFEKVDENNVPDNSLMREFIGGSCFRDV